MTDAETFRQALAYWASGVAVVSFRDSERVIATTVSAFMSLSIDPPLVLLALGPNATVRPFLSPGTRFGVSLLGEKQGRLASVFADPLPVGPDPFTAGGAPLIRDAIAGLQCTVSELHAGGRHLIVVGAVDDADIRGGQGPLIRYDRAYHRLGDA